MNAISNPHRMQKGAALAVGLILLVVATLIALATMRSSVTEERLAGNQKEISEAFMAAEAGIAAAFEWFGEGNNVQAYWGDAAGDSASAITTAKSPGPNARVTWQIIDVDFLTDGDGNLLDTAIIESEGRITATQTTRAVRSTYKRPVNLGTSQAFLVGMLSDQNIWISGGGQALFEGGIHSNGQFDNNAGQSTLRDGFYFTKVDNGSGTHVKDSSGDYIVSAGGDYIRVDVPASISAAGNANFGGDYSGATGGDEVDGPVLSSTSPIQVPSAAAYIEQNRDGAIPRCDFSSLQPDLLGEVYFCDGSVELGNGAWGNGTIMATGSVEIKGRSVLNAGGELSFAIYAAGDIINRGRDDSYGVFWTDGEFQQRGRSLIAGAIVAGGDIRRDGNMHYMQQSNFSAGLPLPQDIEPPAISAWKEIW